MPRPGYRSVSFKDADYKWYEEEGKRIAAALELTKPLTVPETILYIRNKYELSTEQA